MALTSTRQPAYDLNTLRAEFDTAREGFAYLNHAGMSPIPRRAAAAMHDLVEDMAKHGGGAFGKLFPDLTDTLRDRIAELVRCHPIEIAFPNNTSTAMNFIAQSLPLSDGDNVILCDVEFPSNVYPWQNLTHKGVETRLVPAVSGGLSIDAIEAARDENTRVVSVSGVQFFTGRREDLSGIGTYCAEHNLLFTVDAIQAAGIVPIDMAAMNIAALAAGGQKALMGAPGQGFMAVRSDLIEQMQAIFVGCASVSEFEKWLQYGMTPLPGADRFDLGTPNLPGLVALRESVGLLLELGVENIAEWVTYLSDVLIEDLQARGYVVITPEQHAHIVTFRVESDDVMSIVTALAERGIIVREHLNAASEPHLRISTHAYNTVEEVLRVGKALEEVTT